MLNDITLKKDPVSLSSFQTPSRAQRRPVSTITKVTSHYDRRHRRAANGKEDFVRGEIEGTTVAMGSSVCRTSHNTLFSRGASEQGGSIRHFII